MTQSTMSEARRYQQLRADLCYLKLNDAAEVLPRILDEVRAERLTLTAALERLLEFEVTATEQRELASRMRFACLPEPWTLADFNFAAQPSVEEKLIRDLTTLRFVDDASNVLLVGPPGTGKKTMLAIALARAAAEAGHRVCFTTTADLWPPNATRPPSKAAGPPSCGSSPASKLLVIDEPGYLPLLADGASALSQVINQRYLKSSTILTTNVGIADWADAFGDATVAAAMPDRLLHYPRTRSRRSDPGFGHHARLTPAERADGWRRCCGLGHPVAGRFTGPDDVGHIRQFAEARFQCAA